MNNKKLKLHSSGDAADFLGVSYQWFCTLARRYKIPFHQTGAGKIYEEETLTKFRSSDKRANNLRYRNLEQRRRSMPSRRKK